MAMTVFVVVPFIVLIGYATPQVNPQNWLLVDWDTVNWTDYLNNMFWSAAPPSLQSGC